MPGLQSWTSGIKDRNCASAFESPSWAEIQVVMAGMSGYQGKDFTTQRAICRGVRVCTQPPQPLSICMLYLQSVLANWSACVCAYTHRHMKILEEILAASSHKVSSDGHNLQNTQYAAHGNCLNVRSPKIYCLIMTGEEANLCVERGQEVVDEHVLLSQILLQRIHVLAGLPCTLQPVSRHRRSDLQLKMSGPLMQLVVILHKIASANSMCMTAIAAMQFQRPQLP